jgi:O-antigen ligase
MVLVLEQLVVDDRTARRVLAAIYLSAVVPIAVGLFQLSTGGGTLIGSFTRIDGTFAHPNPFAMYLVLLVVMGVALFEALPVAWRYAMASLLTVAGLALFATYARGAWIAAIVGLVVMGLAQHRRRLVAVTIGVAVVLLLLIPSTRERFGDLTAPDKPSGASSNSLTWRVDYWGDALDLAATNPLTGIGLKNVSVALDEGAQPHNDYVRVAVELGAVGLLAFLGYLATLTVIARRAVRRAETDFGRAIATGFCGCLAAFVTLSLTSNILSQVVVLWYFVSFAALASATSRGVIGRGSASRRQHALVSSA